MPRTPRSREELYAATRMALDKIEALLDRVDRLLDGPIRGVEEIDRLLEETKLYQGVFTELVRLYATYDKEHVRLPERVLERLEELEDNLLRLRLLVERSRMLK